MRVFCNPAKHTCPVFVDLSVNFSGIIVNTCSGLWLEGNKTALMNAKVQRTESLHYNRFLPRHILIWHNSAYITYWQEKNTSQFSTSQNISSASFSCVRHVSNVLLRRSVVFRRGLCIFNGMSDGGRHSKGTTSISHKLIVSSYPNQDDFVGIFVW